MSAAAKYKLANVTSSWVMNAGSAKKPWPSWLFTCRVTSRYMRLKHARPSAAGSAAAIASIRVIAPATEVTGASGADRAVDIGVTIRSVLGMESGLLEEDLAMSDRIPASGDADDQRGSEPDLSATDEFAKMRAVMRASEKHREGGVDPELEVADADPGPDA